MAEHLSSTRYRYPGIRSFERAEAGQFFGRSRETAELFSLVKVKPLTVLFAKSGIGKTSLINAGLAPLLEKDGFLPIKIRLQDTSISPVDTVKKVLEPFLNDDLLKKYAGENPSLWEYFRACTFIAREQTRTPVLFFDQFEELFNHAPKQRDALTLELADLVNERLPDPVQERLRQFPRRERDDEVLNWFSPARLRVVFAIRADRMGELDRLKRHIPTVLHDRYYLQPMRHEAAREAIILPAALTDAGSEYTFRTAPFLYSDAALDAMLSALGNENGEVESFQLQLLCRHIEELAAARRLQTVEPETFGGSAGVGAILNDYYEREIGRLDPNEQIVARRFIEEGLIDNGRRVGVPAGVEHSRFGVTSVLLGKLLDSRLIRAEVIHLGNMYELSHDTLVEPVLRSYEQRQREEERRRAEQALADERARLAEISKKRRRARLFAVTGFVLAALALAGGGIAWSNAKAAEKARKAADVSALAARAWEVYREDHTLAFRLAQAALALDSNNVDARQTLHSMVNISTTSFYQSVFSDHYLDVLALDFSPDGDLVASGGYDKEVFIWKRENGQVVTSLLETGGGHTAPVRDVRFAPDGASLFSAGDDGRVLQLGLDGAIIQDIRAHAAAVSNLDISTDGALMITGSDDLTAVIRNIKDQKKTVLRGHTGKVRAAVFSPDSRWALTGATDGTARLWNVASGTCVHVFNAGPVNVNAAAFSPNGQLVLLGCSDRTARLFDRNGMQLLTISGHGGEVVKVAFTPGGKNILTASADGTAKLWSPEGAELLHLVGHTQRLACLAISNDGRWLATGGFDYTAKVWDLPFNLHKKASQHSDWALKVAVSPDGSRILSGSKDQTAICWDRQGKLLFTLEGHRGAVASVAFSPDGQHCLTGSGDGSVRIWTSTGQLLHHLEMFQAPVNSAVYHPGGGLIAVGSGSSVWVLDSSGAVQKHWVAHRSAVKSVVFSPDGQSVLSAGADGHARCWTLDGLPTDSLSNEGVPLRYALFSPDGQSIFTAAHELPLRVWKRDGQLQKSLYGPLYESYHLAFSPDGALLASSGWDKAARIWSAEGKLLHTLPHPDGVYGAAWFPDSRSMVTACRDGLLRLWDARSGAMTGFIGGNVDPAPLLTDERIAPLASIRFSPERYGISPQMAVQICGTDANHLAGMGARYLEEAGRYHYDYNRGLADIRNAELFFQKGRGLASGVGKVRFDSLLAQTFLTEANHHLLNRRLPEFRQAVQNGLHYKALPMLRFFDLVSRLMEGKDTRARGEAVAWSRDTLTPLGDYLNFREAMLSESDYYLRQLGIQSAELEAVVQILEAEQNGQ